MKIKLSKGLQAVLQPLINIINLPESLAYAIAKAGKRGNKAYYPGDLARCKVVLETVHDVTGAHFEVIVQNGNMAQAIETLKKMVINEDNLCNSFLT